MERRTVKKEAGNAAVTRLLALIIVIIAAALITVQYAGNTKILNTKDEISLIMRKYIIRMETNGFLTDTDKKAMSEELKAAGMTTVDFTGTTTDEVQYGEIIYLRVKGSISVKSYNVTGLFDGSWGTVTLDIDETRSSTSQK